MPTRCLSFLPLSVHLSESYSIPEEAVQGSPPRQLPSCSHFSSFYNSFVRCPVLLVMRCPLTKSSLVHWYLILSLHRLSQCGTQQAHSHPCCPRTYSIILSNDSESSWAGLPEWEPDQTHSELSPSARQPAPSWHINYYSLCPSAQPTSQSKIQHHRGLKERLNLTMPCMCNLKTICLDRKKDPKWTLLSVKGGWQSWELRGDVVNTA